MGVCERSHHIHDADDPAHERKAALVVSLARGNYTAIVRGRNGTTGVALVEAETCSNGARRRDANSRGAQPSGIAPDVARSRSCRSIGVGLLLVNFFAPDELFVAGMLLLVLRSESASATSRYANRTASSVSHRSSVGRPKHAVHWEPRRMSQHACRRFVSLRNRALIVDPTMRARFGRRSPILPQRA